MGINVDIFFGKALRYFYKKYNSFKADTYIQQLDEELIQVAYDLAHLTDFAIAYFKDHTMHHADETIGVLDEVRDWHDGLIEIQEDVQAIYAYETMPALIEVQDLLQAIRKEAKNKIMTINDSICI